MSKLSAFIIVLFGGGIYHGGVLFLFMVGLVIPILGWIMCVALVGSLCISIPYWFIALGTSLVNPEVAVDMLSCLSSGGKSKK